MAGVVWNREPRTAGAQRKPAPVAIRQWGEHGIGRQLRHGDGLDPDLAAGGRRAQSRTCARNRRSADGDRRSPAHQGEAADGDQPGRRDRHRGPQHRPPSGRPTRDRRANGPFALRRPIGLDLVTQRSPHLIIHFHLPEYFIDHFLGGADAPFGGGQTATASRRDGVQGLALEIAKRPGQSLVRRQALQHLVEASQKRALFGRRPRRRHLLDREGSHGRACGTGGVAAAAAPGAWSPSPASPAPGSCRRCFGSRREASQKTS